MAAAEVVHGGYEFAGKVLKLDKSLDGMAAQKTDKCGVDLAGSHGLGCNGEVH
jgi:hypothetical protein